MKKILSIILTVFLMTSISTAEENNPKAEKLSWSLFPFLIYNSDIGFGFGGKGVIKNLYAHEESFDLILFGSSKGEQWYAFTFSIPDFELRQGTLYDWSFDTKIEYNKVLKSNFFGFGNNTEDNEWQFPKESVNAEFVFGRALTKTLIIEGGILISHTSVFGYQKINPLIHPDTPGEGEGFWNYITLRTRYDSRDSQIDPRKGWRIFPTLDISSKHLGSDENFNRYRLETSHYRALIHEDFIIATRLWMQHVDGKAPYFYQSALGGSWTMRGYKADRFVDRTFILSSLETRFPIYKRLGGVLFIDMGRTYSDWGKIGVNDYKTNIGVGFRFYLKNFLARFDAGNSPEGTRIFFHFGHVF